MENGRSIRENPTKMDDFRATPYSRKPVCLYPTFKGSKKGGGLRFTPSACGKDLANCPETQFALLKNGETTMFMVI